MKLLLLDIGNTYTKIKLNDESYRFKSSELLDSFSSLNLSFDSCIISSVVKDLDIKMKELIDKKYNVDSLIVDHSLAYKCYYPKEKNELGSDLIALMEGCALKSKTFMCFSFGTASVVLLVKDYKFSGCAIAPGVLTSLNGLISSASLIENTVLKGKYDFLGFDTDGALRSGTWNSFKYIEDGYISEIKKTYGNMPIYFFGGFSEILKDLSSYKDEIILDQNILNDGLESIYKMNRSVK